MGGLARIAKLYGGITINGKKMVWDYVADEAVPVEQMKPGSARWKASERARWQPLKDEMDAKKATDADAGPGF